MNRQEADHGRRVFLEQIGLGAGALALMGVPGFTRTLRAQACPVINPGTATAFRYDCRPIRPRRPASTLSSAEIQKLRDAYKAMRALDSSDPTDRVIAVSRLGRPATSPSTGAFCFAVIPSIMAARVGTPRSVSGSVSAAPGRHSPPAPDCGAETRAPLP